MEIIQHGNGKPGRLIVGGRIFPCQNYSWQLTSDELEEYLFVLDPIAKRRDVLNFLSGLTGKPAAESSESLFNDQVRDAASALIPEIDKFLDVLRSLDADAGKRGRRNADSVGLIKIIAGLYSRHIDAPSNKKGGPFETVAKLTLEFLGFPCKDPSRAIKNALSSMTKMTK